jgi:hypothetical protein
MMPLNMDAVDDLSLEGELDARRENSSGSSSWQSTASSSFVAVMTSSTSFLQRQRMRHAGVPSAARSPFWPLKAAPEKILHTLRNQVWFRLL